MTNQNPNSFKYTPPSYRSMRNPDLLSDRDITFGRETPTPNKFLTSAVPGHPNVIEWEFHLNSVDRGLGRIRGALESLIGRTRGETEDAPLDTRYVDSLHLPAISRYTSTPAVTVTAASNPAYRAEASNSGTGTAVTGNEPLGTAVGDTLIAWVIFDDASTAISAVPSGWSLLNLIDPGASGDFAAAMYTKIAVAADVGAGSWAWTLSASERWRTIVVAAQSGSATGVTSSATGTAANSAAGRFYLPSSGTAPISPAYDSAWEHTTHAARLPTYSTKQGTPITEGWSGQDGQTNDALFRQFVSPPLAAQTISAQTVKIQMQGV